VATCFLPGLMGLLVCVGPALADEPRAQALLADGTRLPNAGLESIGEAGQLLFSTNGRSREIDSTQLVRWGWPSDPRRAPVIVSSAGELFPAREVTADENAVRAATRLLGARRWPRDDVAGIAFTLSEQESEREKLFDWLARVATESRAPGEASPRGNSRESGGEKDQMAPSIESDILLLANGDQLTGRLVEIGDRNVVFETSAGRLEVARQRVAAVRFAMTAAGRNAPLRGSQSKPPADEPDARQQQPNFHWAGLTDGSLWRIGSPARLARVEARDVCYLQPIGGRVVYLSDLPVDDYRQVPYLELSWPFARDRSVSGGWLRASGKRYLKGLGLHSAARLTYRLRQPLMRFQAEVVMDDSAKRVGTVRIRVFVDGREQGEPRTVRAGGPTIPVDIALPEGASRLDLIVEFGERGPVLDRVQWLDARLIR